MNVEGRVFKRVMYFKYLDHHLILDNDLIIEINTRI